MAPNGVCIHYPSLPVFGEVTAVPMLLLTSLTMTAPFIVTPR